MSCFRCASDREDGNFPRKFKCVDSNEFETITDEQIVEAIKELTELKETPNRRFFSTPIHNFEMKALQEIYESLYRNENYRWWLMK